MCDNCIITLNEHLQLSTTKLRDQLIVEEKKHIKYMEACKKVFQNKDSHNCEEVCRPILKIIGLPKTKKRKNTKTSTLPVSPT